jgi:hypothetical protein
MRSIFAIKQGLMGAKRVLWRRLTWAERTGDNRNEGGTNPHAASAVHLRQLLTSTFSLQ